LHFDRGSKAGTDQVVRNLVSRLLGEGLACLLKERRVFVVGDPESSGSERETRPGNEHPVKAVEVTGPDRAVDNERELPTDSVIGSE
jgi:hypothetical protein